MIRTLPLAVAGAATLFLAACANDLSPEQTDRPAAPFVDPSGAVPQHREDLLGDGSVNGGGR
ncbi:MAG: hypothetical protein M3Y69_02865 [Verrucomicrobiota bacterium]|nr:hypothetical protein [Verrucomicrobiota bacterium]